MTAQKSLGSPFKILFLQELTESYFGQQFTDSNAKDFFCELVVEFAVEEITLQARCGKYSVCECGRDVTLFFVKYISACVLLYASGNPQPLVSLNFVGDIDDHHYEYIQGSAQSISGEVYFLKEEPDNSSFYRDVFISTLSKKTRVCALRSTDITDIVTQLNQWIFQPNTPVQKPFYRRRISSPRNVCIHGF